MAGDVSHLGERGRHVWNWAGRNDCVPECYFEPETTEEIRQIVNNARAAGKQIRVLGVGHSFSDQAMTSGYMICLKKFNKVLQVYQSENQIKVEAGITVKDLNEKVLPSQGMAISVQGVTANVTIGGAVSTGTHGTGGNYGIMSDYIVDMEIMTSSGEIMEISETSNADLLPAAKLSIGALGVILNLTLQCEPAYNLHQRSYTCDLKDFGGPLFSVSGFIGFLIATMTSVLDSIGSYYACASICRVPPPPSHAVNRGIAVEGFCSMLSGWFGAAHATTTYGGNIGAIGMTKAASRHVFVAMALMYILLAVVSKFTAAFVSIPYPVLGGVLITIMGAFYGLVLSNLQVVDLTSVRNMTIIGMSIFVGLLVPSWVEAEPTGIDTGNKDADTVIKIFLGNPNFVGSILACFLDNTVPEICILAVVPFIRVILVLIHVDQCITMVSRSI